MSVSYIITSGRHGKCVYLPVANQRMNAVLIKCVEKFVILFQITTCIFSETSVYGPNSQDHASSQLIAWKMLQSTIANTEAMA